MITDSFNWVKLHVTASFKSNFAKGSKKKFSEKDKDLGMACHILPLKMQKNKGKCHYRSHLLQVMYTFHASASEHTWQMKIDLHSDNYL